MCRVIYNFPLLCFNLTTICGKWHKRKQKKKKKTSQIISTLIISRRCNQKNKKTNSFFIFKQQLPCYLVSECAITINLHAGKICLGQTMNMTKCEIPQPLSMSHFPGSCWGKAGRIDPLSTAFGRRVAHFFFFLHGNLSTFSRPKSYGSHVPLERIQETTHTHEKQKELKAVTV